MHCSKRLGLILLLAGGTWLPTANARAALDATGQREVQALLAFVGASHCTFIRNGSSYAAADAQAHLQNKLDYLERRNLVNSAEDFIKQAASQSSLSGKPYKVNCDGQERLSADWLGEELQHLRQAQP